MKLNGELVAWPSLPPEEELLIPLYRRLGRPLRMYRRNGEQSSCALSGIEPRFLGLPGRSLVVTPNDVPLLSFLTVAIRVEGKIEGNAIEALCFKLEGCGFDSR
jgi:hypothetical protein